jgi:CIC family chloride channel protein
MAATFSSPIAATLLAVELLLFEWKPRSFVPVALACATATVIRRYIIGLGPLFPTPPHPAFIGPGNMLACVLVGLLAGILSSLLTVAVYAAEDAFRKLPIHWMWWPAIGGLVIGIGGLIYPQALGVGYDVISQFLAGRYTLQLLLGVLIVKSIIWSVSLGSGTSGGVLAPLLIMGGALGGLESLFLPNLGPGFWPLVSMGATLGGTMRSPFTGVIFMLELTHDVNMLLPLLVAVTIAHGFTVLVMRRSILTEKVSRRGYHLSREYAIDPLEIIFVREVMRTNVIALPDTIQQQDLVKILRSFSGPASHDGHQGKSTQGLKGSQRQRLFPVLDADQRMIGVVTYSDLVKTIESTRPDAQDGQTAPIELHYIQPVVAYTNEPLRAAVYRMAETGFTRFPVVERSDPHHVVGMISLTDLLKARARSLTDERQRERILRLRLLFPRPPASQETRKAQP